MSDRLSAALAIRDAVLAWARAGGYVREIAPGERVLQRHDPATRWGAIVPVRYEWSPGESWEGRFGGLDRGKKTPPLRAYGLTLWRGRKLLSLRWDDSGMKIIRFARGGWEAEALRLAPPPGAA
jgi:hypothetical protein